MNQFVCHLIAETV